MATNEKGAGQGALAQHFQHDQSKRTHAPTAKNVLKDAIIAAGVEPYAGVAILAAAESYAKARLRDEFAAFMSELNDQRGVPA